MLSSICMAEADQSLYQVAAYAYAMTFPCLAHSAVALLCKCSWLTDCPALIWRDSQEDTVHCLHTPFLLCQDESSHASIRTRNALAVIKPAARATRWWLACTPFVGCSLDNRAHDMAWHAFTFMSSRRSSSMSSSSLRYSSSSLPASASSIVCWALCCPVACGCSISKELLFCFPADAPACHTACL